MPRLKKIAAVLCLGALVGCDSAADDFIDGSIAGFVFDAETGAPLADATVRLAWERPMEPGQVLTVTSVDDEGFYVNLFRAAGTCDERGDLTLRAEAPGYEPEIQVVPCVDETVEGERDFELGAR